VVVEVGVVSMEVRIGVVEEEVLGEIIVVVEVIEGIEVEREDIVVVDVVDSGYVVILPHNIH